MNTSKRILSVVIFGFGFGFSSLSQAGLLYNYSQLALKDLDQMNSMVLSKIKESKKSSGGKEVPLKEALQAVYSRPNEDGMVEKVVASLRTELDELDAWEKTLNDLTVEALDALANPKAFRPVVQVTYQLFLENLLADMKPFLHREGFERGLAEKIRNAKVDITKESRSERRLRMMKSTISPSELADQLLDSIKIVEDAAVEKPDDRSSDKIAGENKSDKKADKKSSKKAPKEDSKKKNTEGTERDPLESM